MLCPDLARKVENDVSVDACVFAKARRYTEQPRNFDGSNVRRAMNCGATQQRCVAILREA
jgi:hypothetical protein